ncbi:hypothetical protein CKAN_02683100 [Cinnamomum micranthum f. kanehirae]|uniref:Uncharacterized protein n=1 Tax=Cinnamomum micranthum f. kanehirae TaxID=337451 RepID=A0A3S3R9M0_9MAGN|nr:hypothetical protein CKAN_02683100 [Cinnamomum micranthum f. kanehirae]
MIGAHRGSFGVLAFIFRRKLGFFRPRPSSELDLCIAELLRRTCTVIQFLREEIKRDRENGSDCGPHC